MYSIKTLQDAHLAINELEERIAVLGSKDLNLKGFRISNTGASRRPSDVVVREELTQVQTNLSGLIRQLGYQLQDLKIRIGKLESV